MSQHVFIVMPFGIKVNINFNKIYQDLIKPALLDVGLEPFRADEEILPGDLRADMFQELLMADLVVDGQVVIELKVADALTDVHIAQVLNYLRATGLKVGLLINFHAARLQWKRLVL